MANKRQEDVAVEEATPEEQAGVADGEVVTGRDDENKPVQEEIVYDYDEENNYVGFHKEVVE